MKKLIYFFIYLVVFILNREKTISQGWEWQNPLPQGDALGEICFVDSLNGWIMTNPGRTIMHTIDGGVNWDIQYIQMDNYNWINNFYFKNTRLGWAVNNIGEIFKTNNGGKNWIRLPGPKDWKEPLFLPLYTIYFIDSLKGYISGYLCMDGMVSDTNDIFNRKTEANLKNTNCHYGTYFTSDGGMNWNKILSNEQHYIKSIFFNDSLSGWYTMKNVGYLYHTKDGGDNWEIDSNLVKRGIYCDEIFFVDNKHGFISNGENLIICTINGGDTWNVYTVDTERFNLYVNRISFIDSLNGWLSGIFSNNQLIYKTIDGGKKWIKTFEGLKHLDENRLAFCSKQRGFLTSYNNLYESNDGGFSWEIGSKNIFQNPSTFGRYMNDIDFVDKYNGWAIGGDRYPDSTGYIIHTTNGGKKWEIQLTLKGNVKGFISYGDCDIQFINGSNGWFINIKEIFHTDDGGKTWNKYLPEINGQFKKIHFLDEKNGWAIVREINSSNPRCHICFTSNSGITWVDRTPVNINTISSLYFSDSLTGCIAVNGINGSSYTVLFTSDGGKNWENKISDLDLSTGDIYFADPKNGWFVTYRGIYKTNDFGKTWEKIPDVILNTRKFKFIDKDNGYAVGDWGLIYYTNDGGKTWIRQESFTRNQLRSIDFVDKNNGWAVGDLGTILFTDKGSSLGYDNPKSIYVPLKDFTLNSNYPNPFNNSTIISFNIFKSRANVKLVVYDILGREIKTLLNDSMNEGFYNIPFNGKSKENKSISSGVYFYLLQVDDQIKTGKMILNK